MERQIQVGNHLHAKLDMLLEDLKNNRRRLDVILSNAGAAQDGDEPNMPEPMDKHSLSYKVGELFNVQKDIAKAIAALDEFIGESQNKLKASSVARG